MHSIIVIISTIICLSHSTFAATLFGAIAPSAARIKRQESLASHRQPPPPVSDFDQWKAKIDEQVDSLICRSDEDIERVLQRLQDLTSQMMINVKPTWPVDMVNQQRLGVLGDINALQAVAKWKEMQQQRGTPINQADAVQFKLETDPLVEAMKMGRRVKECLRFRGIMNDMLKARAKAMAIQQQKPVWPPTKGRFVGTIKPPVATAPKSETTVTMEDRALESMLASIEGIVNGPDLAVLERLDFVVSFMAWQRLVQGDLDRGLLKDFFLDSVDMIKSYCAMNKDTAHGREWGAILLEAIKQRHIKVSQQEYDSLSQHYYSLRSAIDTIVDSEFDHIEDESIVNALILFKRIMDKQALAMYMADRIIVEKCSAVGRLGDNVLSQAGSVLDPKADEVTSNGELETARAHLRSAVNNAKLVSQGDRKVCESAQSHQRRLDALHDVYASALQNLGIN